ncbi:MAG TPA: hypothetical protein VN604_02210 [Nitrospirota bacterium]|nr:hypothetical protein [Nitrospirota bacterium]
MKSGARHDPERGPGTGYSCEVRLRYLYRSLIIRGRIRISLESARRLAGPDCAYHLYPLMEMNPALSSRKR